MLYYSLMVDKRSNEKMDDLRERLYSRGESPRPRERVSLKPPATISEQRSDIVKKPVTPPPPPPPSVEAEVDMFDEPERLSKRRSYLKWLVLIALGFFLVSVVASSLYMILGRNSVSGSNIDVSITGPFTIGGGDLLNLQVGITNQNAVPIESATLIVEYPAGTRADDDASSDMRSERIAIDSGINAGETRNIPLKARVFGEENQEVEVRVSVEYRVAGSSATFYKEASPHRFKISHAPVTLKVEAEETISSGQETTIKLTVTSNSSSPVSNLLVRAEYPNGFDFSGASPAPVSGRNVWQISKLEPEGSVTIDITGVVVGTQSEKYVMKFSVGVASDRNPNDLSSILAVGDTEFTLEDPFLDLSVSVDGSENDSVTITPGSQSTILIEVRNTLNSPVYDGLIEVRLSGNALSDTDVSVSNGYYDSNTRTVRFDSSAVSGLRRINSGSTERVSFSLRPDSTGLESPQVTIDVSAAARRVSESSAREQIAGTHQRILRVESRPTVSSELIRATSGPTPPEVGETTTYEIRWRVNNSANSISGAVVSAVLPSYVTWADNTGGGGAWSYNPSNRTVEWRVGEVSAGAGQTGTFRVELLPSSSLAGRTPTLVEAAHLRSNDNFTGSLLRHSTNAITTEFDGERNSGVVQSN